MGTEQSKPARGLRVAHVFGGTEGGSWVFDQLLALRDTHGCEVFAVLGGTEGTLPGKCRSAGIPIKALDFGTVNVLSLPWRFLAFAWWLRRMRIDVVQSHVINSTFFARPAAWLADVPVRLTMVTGPYYMQSPGFRLAELRSCQLETGIIPSCELTATLYREARVPEGLICETLYYGPPAHKWDPASTRTLGLRQRLGLAEGTPLIGVVAIFYPRFSASGDYVPSGLHGRMAKGHEDLVAAMPLILAEFPEAKMLFIGKGWGPQEQECEDEIRRIIADAGMERHILLTGFVDDVAGAYLDIDVSVQASLNDNLGGTVESLLMARPTVATRVGGLVDAVVDGETGILVAPGDPVDLARGIRDMLRDPERARRLGEAGRERMLSRFTLESTGSGLAALYARQRAQAAKAWRTSRILLRPFYALVRFFPVMSGAIRPGLARLLVPRAYRAFQMLPQSLRRGIRSLMRIGRRQRPSN